MGGFERIAVFYSHDDEIAKDSESELFTEDNKENFHFFFFHNKDLHFSREIIYKKELIKKFESVSPFFYTSLDDKSVVMQKRLSNFDREEFDTIVDTAYKDYLSRITYRIDCIFQTFSLFINLYKNKHLIFVFPSRLYQRFTEELEINKLSCTELSNLDLFSTKKMLDKFDILHWINYYTRKDIVENAALPFTDNNISGIYSITADNT